MACERVRAGRLLSPSSPADQRIWRALDIARFVVRRLIFSGAVLAGVLVLVFIMGHAVGDPARLMLPPGAPRERYEELRTALGLDAPLYEQFVRTIGDWLRGDFGTSLWQRVPALPLAIGRMPATIYLAFVTLLLAVPVGVLLGAISAIRPGSKADKILTVVSLSGVSIADFWLALMLILVFGVQLGWLPTSGYGGLNFVLLPSVTLATPAIGRIAQVIRTVMLEQMRMPYVVTARSRGLPERSVVMSHVLRNVAIPAVTFGAGEAAALLNGAIVVETVFAWPGIGKLLIDAIVKRDFPLVQATIFVVTLTVILVNLLVDITYSLLDPRVTR
jgi:peptide/nickel transport system permease protein